MVLQIEEGKFYRARDGRKAGPMTRVADSAPYSPPWIWTNAPRGQPRFGLLPPDYLWRDDGTEAWLLHTESPHDLIAEWVDEYPVWRDMTPEQKGAILLAFHEGKPIECRQDYLVPPQWWRDENPTWDKDCAYRVRPPEVRPQRTTVIMYGSVEGGGRDWGFGKYEDSDCTHRITFDLVDGQPDCASIKMEPME